MLAQVMGHAGETIDVSYGFGGENKEAKEKRWKKPKNCLLLKVRSAISSRLRQPYPQPAS